MASASAARRTISAACARVRVCQISCVRAFSGVFLVRTMRPACQVLPDPVLSYMHACLSWLLINLITVLLLSVGIHGVSRRFPGRVISFPAVLSYMARYPGRGRVLVQ